MEDIIARLTDQYDKAAYAFSRELAAQSAAEDTYYPMFAVFLGLLHHKSSYIRTRGFCLCCAQARWDTAGKLSAALPQLLALLHDPKPTVVRQCLAALHEVALYRPELREALRNGARSIDLSRYKDTMAPLIQKDLDELLRTLE